jgi:hypothetical protein
VEEAKLEAFDEHGYPQIGKIYPFGYDVVDFFFAARTRRSKANMADCTDRARKVNVDFVELYDMIISPSGADAKTSREFRGKNL